MTEAERKILILAAKGIATLLESSAIEQCQDVEYSQMLKRAAEQIDSEIELFQLNMEKGGFYGKESENEAEAQAQG